MLFILYSLAVFLLDLIASYIVTARNRRLMKKSQGCLPPRKLPQKDPLIGIDVLLQDISSSYNKKFLKSMESRHDINGLTYTSKTLFTTTIHTCDPAVIQQVLSFQFPKFDLGPLRLPSAPFLLGKGILTTDGQLWSHKRKLIKPAFSRPHFMNDTSIFRDHVDRLIALIKDNNCNVDLQPLFFRMVSCCKPSFSHC